MRVDTKILYKIITPKSLTIALSYKVIAKEYCDRMTARSLCPGFCFLCMDELNEVTNVSGAKEPYAMMTWKARSMVSTKGEARQEERNDRISDTGSSTTNFLELLNL